MKKIILLYLVFINISGIFAQKNSNISNGNSCSSEEIYIHTDRNYYSTNDFIWFKAYLFDVFENKTDSTAEIIYVELISPEKKIVFVQKYINTNGICYGKIFLPDTLQKGYYQLRAFTDAMKNLSSNYYFTKILFIESKNIYFSKNFIKLHKKEQRLSKKNIIRHNINNTVIAANLDNEFIISTNPFKHSIKIKVNHKKSNLSFKSDNSGITNFLLNPKEKENYTIKIKTENRKTKNLKIKKTNLSDFSVNFYENSKQFEFIINSTKPQSNDTTSNTYFFKIFDTNKIIYEQSFNTFKNNEIIIDKNNLSNGLLNIFVFDFHNEIVYQRSIYNQQKNDFPIEFNYFIAKDTLFLSIESNISEGANLSLSLSNDSTDFINIQDYFSFYSGIPTNNHNYYNIDSNQQINNILLTEPEIKYFINCNKDSLYTKTNEIQISGRVSNILEKLPAKSVNVSLTILNSFNDIFYTKTDEKGFFRFENLNYPDSIEFLLEARTKNDKKHLIIFLDNYDTADIYFNSANYDYSYAKPKIYKEEKPYNQNNKSIHSQADQIIYFDETISSTYTNVLDALSSRVPGFVQNGENSILRGINSINLSNNPLYLIDNTPVDINAVANMNINDVERVEIIKSSSIASIYGQRGANGVIAIYTKQGYNIIWGELYGKIAGISSNEDFLENKSNGFYQTYCWMPDIKINNYAHKIEIPLNKNLEFYVLVLQGITYEGIPVFYKTHLKYNK